MPEPSVLPMRIDETVVDGVASSASVSLVRISPLVLPELVPDTAEPPSLTVSVASSLM